MRVRNITGYLFVAMLLMACSAARPLNFSGVDPALTVAPTEVVVLGTAHLSNFSEDLSQDQLKPLIDRLADYAPNVITIEGSSGMTCSRVREYPQEHIDYAEYYCFDGTVQRQESGLTVAEGSLAAGKALMDWPEVPTAMQRRQLAAAFLASEEPASALVQWLQLDPSEKRAGDGLGPKSIESLHVLSQSMNENYSIAARLAARLGLARVFYADDHGRDEYAQSEKAAYGARVSELWPQEGDPCIAHFNTSDTLLREGELMGAYNYLNSLSSQRKQMGCDWKRTMNDAETEQYGRKYTMGWQARNLRMAAFIMTAAGTKPGGRVLTIVGASHKPYVEAYLDQMHDVKVHDVSNVLN